MAEPDKRHSGCFLQFAKAAVPGRVKTRMHTFMSPGEAAQLAAWLTRRVADSLRQRPQGWALWLCVDDAEDSALGELGRTLDCPIVPQSDGDLGQRMGAAVALALETYRHAIVLGSDCLGYDAGYLDAATRALGEGNDVVLGPASDGGYVLIGFSRFHPGIFDDIPWSSCQVLARQRERLQSMGYSWAELPVRSDVDTPEDLKQAGLATAGLACPGELRRW